MNREVDEINKEELEAAAFIWDHLVKGDFYEIQERQRPKAEKTTKSVQNEIRGR